MKFWYFYGRVGIEERDESRDSDGEQFGFELENLSV